MFIGYGGGVYWGMRRSMREGGMENRVMLWKPVSYEDARFICRMTFVAFIATLIVGWVFARFYGSGLESVFYLAGGVFLGISEVMYWVYKGLQKK
jgi:hypothetical protein